MAKIVHIAVKVDELDRAEEFFEKVFGFEPLGRSRAADRARAQLSDGGINLTFLKYDDNDSDMAKASGEGPSIHHIGIEVDDMAEAVAQLQAFGVELLSAPTDVPVKFRMPGGPLAELLPKGSVDGAGRRRGARPAQV
jgi:lactoylglutathione lyase